MTQPTSSQTQTGETSEARRMSTKADLEGKKSRLNGLAKDGIRPEHLSGETEIPKDEMFQGNIENFIGMAQVPVGLAGPLLVNGNAANGEFYIPLATTEGALVASYHRGMKACHMSGGITSICLTEGVQRTPYFKFSSLLVAKKFVEWLNEKNSTLKEIVRATSRYAQLNNMKSHVQGNSVIVVFEYTTGDAAGQNMVTICTDQICQFILTHFSEKPVEWYVESNYSGDKKATAVSFSNVRGKKVSAEVLLPFDVVQNVLKTTPEKIAHFGQASTLAVVQSGAIGAQGHVANGLTALFMACGQDVACISESSVGITRMEVHESGGLYAALTLPSLIVGTVGGGTGLPTQQECLKMMDCAGLGKAKKFAEICCATALAGEISIASALSANHFTKAHQVLGRKKDA